MSQNVSESTYFNLFAKKKKKLSDPSFIPRTVATQTSRTDLHSPEFTGKEEDKDVGEN